MKSKKNIGVFGHYGNQNLGDEAIIESMINNLNKVLPGSEISCLSINPFDSAERYNLKSFPIRYRKDFFSPAESVSAPLAESQPKSTVQRNTGTTNSNSGKSIKQKIKSIPVLGTLLKSAVNSVSLTKKVKNELFFLRKARAFLMPMDLLLITGSNQLLDNFGGPWGFPYTLLKWTLLGKLTNTKVAFVSVGAGPLTQDLSYKMLKTALNKADYVSYRDNGSKDLIETRIKNINGSVFPDIAHSLCYELPKEKKGISSSNELIIGINPMPVFDKRYWAVPDDNKYQEYIHNVAETSLEILKLGHIVKLFGTQVRDFDVIDDVVCKLKESEQYDLYKDHLKVVVDKSIDELMLTIGSCDIVIATRFHATVLPLQLNVPVLGICYYRKASELLEEVGLGNYHVPIDSFTSTDLIDKLAHLIDNYDKASKNISINYGQYKTDLDKQYDALAKLI